MISKENWFMRLVTPTDCEWKNCLRIFLIAAFICTLIFLPLVIYNNGIFLLYGDYNVQQIPFYKLAHEAIRNGDIGWNWNTDLGANFIGSYSFYLLGSPFFWLTIPFPTEWVPYMMAPLLILKFALASVTAYAFIRRFTKTAQMAIIGGLLYAFSGFMIYNVFYNHFHEVVVFFPLLLIGLEELVVNNRRGLFAISVALNLIVSYYFFVAEVVFLIIYFIVRWTSKGYKMSIRKFIFIAAESILGVMMGMILLLPSALMVLQNPRVGGMLFGYDMLFYNEPQKYGLLIQSLFFPPDMPAFPNFFPDADAKWYSVAAYMPMFGMAGVISFIKDKRKSWLKYILIVLFIIMFIPFLNSAFNGFNYSFYTRWFYMLTLMMSLATVLALENKRIDIKFGLKFNLGIIIAFSLIGILPKLYQDSIVWAQMPNYPIMFWVNVGIAAAGVALTWFLCSTFRKNPKLLYRGSIICLAIFIFTYSLAQLTWGTTITSPNTYKNVVEKGIHAKFDLKDNDNSFYRIDVYNDNYTDNWPMMWGIPSMQAFQSTVPSSIMSFYPEFGVSRDVASRIPSDKLYGLREFLSIKYIFVDKDSIDDSKEIKLPPGFSFHDNQNGFDIYKNNHFLPMGFAYDSFISEKTWNDTSKQNRDSLILKGIMLTNEQEEKYKGMLPEISNEEKRNLTEDSLIKDTDKLRQNSASSFNVTKQGFDSNITLDKENLVLFTVPFEEGWSAKVNGKPAEIEKIDFGFMAVKCPSGENNISFSYKTPGLNLSVLITGIGIFMFILYLILNRFLILKKPDKYAPDSSNKNKELYLDYTSPTNSQIKKQFFKKQNKK